MPNVFTDTSNVDAPASGCFSITASDSTVFSQETRGIYIGVTGNIAIVFTDGTSATLVGVVAGSILPIRAKQVLATGTTATSLVGLY